MRRRVSAGNCGSALRFLNHSSVMNSDTILEMSVSSSAEAAGAAIASLQLASERCSTRPGSPSSHSALAKDGRPCAPSKAGLRGRQRRLSRCARHATSTRLANQEPASTVASDQSSAARGRDRNNASSKTKTAWRSTLRSSAAASPLALALAWAMPEARPSGKTWQRRPFLERSIDRAHVSQARVRQ